MYPPFKLKGRQGAEELAPCRFQALRALGFGVILCALVRIALGGLAALDAVSGRAACGNQEDADGGELGRLMHDFRVKEVKEMQAGALADRVHELKETEKGVEHMCKEMEALRLEGVEEGRMEEKKAVAYSLADRKMSAEEIAEIIKVNIETVKGWLAGSVSTAR